jgi:hypothetical protein
MERFLRGRPDALDKEVGLTGCRVCSRAQKVCVSTFLQGTGFSPYI